jgi:hypothetical protein
VKIEVLVHGGKIGEEDLAKARVAGPILGAGKFPSVLFPLAFQENLRILTTRPVLMDSHAAAPAATEFPPSNTFGMGS